MRGKTPVMSARDRGQARLMAPAVGLALLLLVSLAAAALAEVTLRVEGMTCGT